MPLNVALLLLPMLVVAVTVHEFAHAWSASLLGDDFARRQGRVSLNPVRHLSPLGTLVIFVLGFGWGRPVPVNLYNFKRPKRDYLLTSLAGPLANIIVAAVCVALMHLTRHSYRYGALAQLLMVLTHVLLQLLALINVILAVINLLPIPPLDGSKIWPCLIPGLKPSFGKKTTWIFVIVLLALLWTDSLTPLIRFAHGAATRWMPPSDRDVFHEHLRKGNAATDANDFAGAERHYGDALAVNPGSAETWLRRATVKARQENWQGACDDMTRAIAIEKDNAYHYDFRAVLFDALDRPDEAAADRATAARLGLVPDPNEPPATSPAEGPLPHPRPVTDVDAEAARLLSQEVLEVDFYRTDLSDLLKSVADVGGVEVSVDWKALERIGVLPDTPVNCRGKNMNLRELLERGLQSTGKGAMLSIRARGKNIFIHARAGGRERR